MTEAERLAKAAALRRAITFEIPPDAGQPWVDAPGGGGWGGESVGVYEPSMRESIGNWIYDKAQALGAGRQAAERYRGTGELASDFTPLVGDVTGIDEGARSLEAGSPWLGAGQLAGAAIGAVPVVGPAAKKVGGRVAKALRGSDVYESAAKKPDVSFADFVAKEDPTAGELFEYGGLGQVPDRAQFDLERYNPPRGVPARLENALTDDTAEQLKEYVTRGQELGGDQWYNTDPYRDVFDREWGSQADEKYAEYMDIVAATSPRSKVQDNIRTGSHYWHQVNDPARFGNNPPLDVRAADLADKPPPGYGSVAQKLHRGNIDRLASGGLDPFDNPKPYSFSQNLQGNFRPVTIDTHNFRPLGMLRSDPEFLMGSYNPEKGVTINPKKMVEEGRVSMDEALGQPTYWESKPKKTEYAAYEKWQQDQARGLGMEPAQYQANMWIGAGDITGLQSAPEPFLRTLEKRVQYTARRLGIPAEEVMRRHVRGEIPLLSVGALAGAGAVAGSTGEGGDFQ